MTYYQLWEEARILRNWLYRYAMRKRTSDEKRERILEKTLPMAARRADRRLGAASRAKQTVAAP